MKSDTSEGYFIGAVVFGLLALLLTIVTMFNVHALATDDPYYYTTDLAWIGFFGGLTLICVFLGAVCLIGHAITRHADLQYCYEEDNTFNEVTNAPGVPPVVHGTFS